MTLPLSLIAFSSIGLLVAVLAGYGILMALLFTHWCFQRRSIRHAKRRAGHSSATDSQVETFSRGSELARLRDDVAALQIESDDADKRLQLLEERVELLQQIVVQQATALAKQAVDLDETPVDEEPTYENSVISIYRPMQEKYGTEFVQVDPVYGVVFTERPEHVDELTKIRGIGAVNLERLNAQGVYRFQQIVDWSEQTIENFNSLLGFKGRIQREDWVGQAQLLIHGHETRRAA
jgi:hypothetical protein